MLCKVSDLYGCSAHADSTTATHLGDLFGEIGAVVDLLVDDASWDVRYVVVDPGRWNVKGMVVVEADAVRLLPAKASSEADDAEIESIVCTARGIQVVESLDELILSEGLRSAQEFGHYSVKGEQSEVGRICDLALNADTWKVEAFLLEPVHTASEHLATNPPEWKKDVSWGESKVYMDCATCWQQATLVELPPTRFADADWSGWEVQLTPSQAAL